MPILIKYNDHWLSSRSPRFNSRPMYAKQRAGSTHSEYHEHGRDRNRHFLIQEIINGLRSVYLHS
jgi:hypothetical protein